MRKALLAAMLTLALPSAAGAATLTAPAGTVVPNGASLTGTATGNSTLTASGITVTCNQSDIGGEVTSNPNATGVRGVITNLTFTNSGSPECPTSIGGVVAATHMNPPYDVTVNTGANGFVMTKTGGNITARLTMTVFGATVTCTFTAESVRGTVSGDTVVVSNAPLTSDGGSFPCPSSGSTATYSSTYTVRAGGTPVALD